MLKVYLDLGKKVDATDGIVTVASVIFKQTAYKQFIRPWNRMLRAWGASAFHATDFYPGGGEFIRDTPARQRLFEEDSQRIPALVGPRVRRISIVSFRPEEFAQVAPLKWKERLGTSVHSHAIQLCLIANGWWLHQKYRYESFAYFMETGDAEEGEVLKAVEHLRQDHKDGTAEHIKVSSFTSVDKGDARGLEAADLVAWHWNKYYMDKIRTGKENEPRKDFAALVAASQENIQYIFATGEKLKYFFSLIPPERLDEPT